jgi:hypothetical protein
VVPTRAKHVDSNRSPGRLDPSSIAELRGATIAEALVQLHDLLELYAPMWYTQGHHERAESALRDGAAASASAFVELYHLLEDYAPIWYTSEQHERSEKVLRLVNKA